MQSRPSFLLLERHYVRGIIAAVRCWLGMRTTLGALLLVITLAAASPVAAEGALDVYGGTVYTRNSDVLLVLNLPSGNADHLFHDVRWTDSETFGLRGTYWLESARWIGVGLDVFRFDADVPRHEVNVTIQGATSPGVLCAIQVRLSAFSFDLRLRYPMFVSSAFPRGRLQPFVSAGPTRFHIEVKNIENGEFTRRTASDNTWGYKVGGGLSWALTRQAAFFLEYRRTHVSTEPVLTGSGSGTSIPLRFDLDTRHYVGGYALHF